MGKDNKSGKYKARTTSMISAAFETHLADVEAIGSAGYSMVVNGRLLGPEHFQTTYPDSWQERYEKLNWIALDPVLNWAFRGPGGDERWSDIVVGSIGAKRFMKAAKEVGLCYGAIFVRNIGTGTSFISVARSDRELSAAEMVKMSTIATEFFADVTTEDRLTQKAIDVLQRLADNQSIAEIADALNISESAVKARLNDARKKTGVPSTSGLIMHMRRKGLLQ